jgi:hypothetical protein
MSEPRTIAERGNINVIAQDIHETAVAHGFWPTDRNMGEMLMLMTSELAEALEEHRAGRPPVWYKHEDGCSYLSHERVMEAAYSVAPLSGGEHPRCTCVKQPKPEGWAVEIVDCIVRCLDTLHQADVQNRLGGMGISELIRLKMAYNDGREHKHGKRY